jgi:hypothetical protein
VRSPFSRLPGSQDLKSLGSVPDGRSGTEAQAYVDAESKRWHEIIMATGIHVE